MIKYNNCTAVVDLLRKQCKEYGQRSDASVQIGKVECYWYQNAQAYYSQSSMKMELYSFSSSSSGSSSKFISPRANNNNNTHSTKITITKADNQKGNAHHAGHLWHKQKNNYLTICQWTLMKTKQTTRTNKQSHRETSERKQQETLKEHSNEFQNGSLMYPYNIDNKLIT